MNLVEPMFKRGILSLPEAAQLAQCSVSGLRRLARAGRLPFRARRDSTGWIVDQGSFEDWLRSPRANNIEVIS